jgi:RND family efflux transporter MFP subunit
MANQRPTWLFAVAFLLSLLVSAGCGNQQGPRGRRDGGPEKAPLRVQTTSVQRISVQRQVDLSGTLVSIDQAKVSSEVAGIVRQVLVELGQEVAAGQIVVRLEPRELELALQRAEAQLHQTEAQLGIDGVKVKEPPPDEQISAVRTAAANRDDARAQLARATRLFRQGLLSQADFDTAQTRMRISEAAYQAAFENIQSLKATLRDRRAAVELAQKKLNDAAVRAPVSGSVSERLVQAGEFIRENTPVVALVQVNPLKLQTALQERHAALIHRNQPVDFRVETFPDEVFKGKVAHISPAVDQATRTFTIEVLVDNKDRRLKPGFFANGVIFTRVDDNVMAVSDDAVSTMAGVSTVYVIEGNKVRTQTVKLGAKKGALVEIAEGLNGNEILAASNLSQLATGVLVDVGANHGDYPGEEAPRSAKPTASRIADQGGRP